MTPPFTPQQKLLAALTRAARNQPDPVKRAKIVEKIKQIQSRERVNKWLGQ